MWFSDGLLDAPYAEEMPRANIYFYDIFRLNKFGCDNLVKPILHRGKENLLRFLPLHRTNYTV